MNDMMSKIRPQVFLAILCATIFSCLMGYLAFRLDAIEVMTAIIGAFVGFLAGTSVKLLDPEK